MRGLNGTKWSCSLRRHIRLYGLLCSVVPVLLFVLCGCSNEHGGDEIGLERSVKADVAVVTRQRVPDQQFFPGRVKSKVSIVLGARMPGYVRDIPHEIGDFVKKGQLLVGLDDTDIRSGIAALEQSYKAVSRQQSSLRARFQYVSATYRRIKILHDKGSATQDEFDRVTSEKSALESQIAALDAQARQVKAQLDKVRNQLHYVSIKAPADGRLARKMVDRGAFVMPGMPLVQFDCSGDGAWFAADVDESLISKVSPGMKVSIFVPSVMRTVKATITQTAPESDPVSHTFSILCDISSSGLNSGLYGRVCITTNYAEKLLVPCSALVDRGGITGVYVVDAKRKVHWRVIKLGHVWEKTPYGYTPLLFNPLHDHIGHCFAEILTGMSTGEQVVVSDLNRVQEGCRLE